MIDAVFSKEEFDKVYPLIKEWDFSLTVQKLQEKDYAGWTKERALKAEEDYKRYLAITKALNGYQLVPNGDIDRFWHEHILDTRRYAEDCRNLFGEFLHHYPFFGMRGESDEANWNEAIEFSNNLWQSQFNESLYTGVKNNRDSQKNTHMEGKNNFFGTTINITINISSDGKPTISTESIGEYDQFELRDKDRPDVMKCPQKCPNEG